MLDEILLWAGAFGLLVAALHGLARLQQVRADRDRLARLLHGVAGAHASGDGAWADPGTSSPGHSDPSLRPPMPDDVTFIPARPIAPPAKIRRRWDGRLLSRRESDAVLADVFGELP